MLPHNVRTFNSLANPSFRLYFANGVVSQAAINMQMMARSLLVYRLTGSAALLGAATVVNFLPLLFLSPFGGALADRVKKKYVVIAGQIEGVMAASLVAIPLSTGYLSPDHPSSWWVLVLAYLLDGVGIGLTGPAYQAMIREIVTGEQVMNAVALNSLSMNVLKFAAPLVTGFIIHGLGFAAVFYVMAGLFLAGNVFLVLLPAVCPQPTGKTRRPLADIKEGFTYVRHEPTLMAILTFLMVVVLLAMPYGALMPVFSDSILKVGAEGLGVLLSVSGVGATLVSAIIASLPNKKRGLFLLAGTLLLGATLTAFSFSTIWTVSLVLIFFVGLGDAVRMTVGNTLVLYYSEHTYWGRVVSVQNMQWGLSSLGVLLAGLLAQEIGVQWAIGGFAMTLVIVSLFTIVFVPRLRRLD